MKKPTAVMLFLFFAVSLFSLDVSAITSIEDAEFPLTHNIVWKDDVDPELELLPSLPGTEQIQQCFSELRPEIAVEKLYRVSLSPNAAGDVRSVFLRLANIFGNPETQTKYMYDSHWRGEVPLIEEAYICNERGRKALPLQFGLADIPGTFEYFQYADEANFSGIIMKVSLDITERYVRVSLENVRNLRLGILSVLPKESIFVENFFFVEGNALYVYSISQLKKDISIKRIGPSTVKPAGMIRKRMDVMAGWVAGELTQ